MRMPTPDHNWTEDEVRRYLEAVDNLPNISTFERRKRKRSGLAKIMATGEVVNAYLEGLENANIPDELIEPLVRDFANSLWRRMWGFVEDVDLHAEPSPYDTDDS